MLLSKVTTNHEKYQKRDTKVSGKTVEGILREMHAGRIGQHRQTSVNGIGDQKRCHRSWRSRQDEVDAKLPQTRVQGRKDRHVQTARRARHHASTADRAQLTRYLEKHLCPPTSADQRERGHWETVISSRRAEASAHSLKIVRKVRRHGRAGM